MPKNDIRTLLPAGVAMFLYVRFPYDNTVAILSPTRGRCDSVSPYCTMNLGPSACFHATVFVKVVADTLSIQ